MIICSKNSENHRGAAFDTLVASIPARKREDGSEYYTGGLLELDGATRRAVVVPDGKVFSF